MRLITEEMFDVLEKEVAQAERSLLIVSPYVKKEVADQIVEIVKDKKLDLKLLTLPPGVEYVTGATDLEAILTLQHNGFEIRMLPFLHAKMYLIDETELLIGSANFTNRGLGLAKESNREILIKKKASRTDLSAIENEFWNCDEVIEINQLKDFAKQVHELQSKYASIQKQLQDVAREFTERFSSFPSPHEKLLMTLHGKGMINSYVHIKNGFHKHAFTINDKYVVEIMRAKQASDHQAKNYENFSYEISEKSAKLFHDRKVKALILILEEPDQFVCLPTTFLIEKILLKSYEGKNGGVQFKIKRRGDELLLWVKGRRMMQRRNIKKYEGSLYFKVLK